MAITVTGKNLKIEDVYKVAYGLEKIELHPDAVERIKACRAFIEKRIEAREIMYGVNTGIGEFSEVVLNDEQVGQFQKYLIYNHAAGIGTPVPIPEVRAAMLGRINVHANGYSGCRPEITQTYVAMLNKGVTPVVCNKGSVGACGDLAPMSQIALLLMGEGEAFYEGERLNGTAAIEEGRHPGPGAQGPRRPGVHQRQQRDPRHGLPADLRHRALAQAGRDRRRDDPGSAEGQHETVRRPPARPCAASRARSHRPRTSRACVDGHRPARARSRSRCRTPTACAPRRR